MHRQHFSILKAPRILLAFMSPHHRSFVHACSAFSKGEREEKERRETRYKKKSGEEAVERVFDHIALATGT